MKTIFDLSQPVENQMTYFPGDPKPSIQPAADVAAPWQVSQLHLGSHTGTHIDAASHYYAERSSIDRYPLERFLLPGGVAEAIGLSPDQAISAEAIRPALAQLPRGGTLLIRTGWDQFWKTEEYYRHPYISAEAAKDIVKAGVSLVGIDALNVDSTEQGSSLIHEILLGNDVLIVENLAHLDQLETGRIYRFSFLPILLPGLDGSPIRAVAWEV